MTDIAPLTPVPGDGSRSEESQIWTGSPSQWLNAGWYITCLLGVGVLFTVAALTGQPLLAGLAIIPAIAALVKFLTVRSTRIDVTTERITTTVGIFSRRKWDMELYRVKDTMLHEPFLLRLVRRANIQIISSDRSSPSITLPALPNAEWLRQQIRSNVERLRLKRGVREMDMDHIDH
ncbi:MAG TPA: PH domain-containing protein [Gemmatimonadaceae bacterium]